MKKRLSTNIDKLLSDYLQEDVDEQYNQSYLGVVEDNNDPLKYGRVRVRLHGLYDDIPTEALPWSTPNFPLGAGGVKGSFIVPEVGVVINVTFDDGDIYEPKYDTKCLDAANLNFEADKDEDYPNSVIFYETSNGDYFKINRAKGEYIIKTGAGVFFKMCENGDVVLSNESSEKGDLNVTLNGNITIDNRYGNTYNYVNNISTSAFGDISTKANGGILEECLDDKETYAHGDIVSIAGNNTTIKTKEKLEFGSTEVKVRTNEIDIKPIIAGKPFQYSMCADELQTPFITVTPSPKGGPFNALLFDTFTGAPHQGRVVLSPPVSKSVDDVTDIALQKIEIKAKVTLKYAKLLKIEVDKIVGYYTSIDSQGQLLLASLRQDNMLETKKAEEILAITTTLNTMRDEEIERKQAALDDYIVTSIFDEEYKTKQQYESDLILAEVEAKLDITKKSRGKDIIGCGDGLVKDKEEL